MLSIGVWIIIRTVSMSRCKKLNFSSSSSCSWSWKVVNSSRKRMSWSLRGKSFLRIVERARSRREGVE